MRGAAGRTECRLWGMIRSCRGGVTLFCDLTMNHTEELKPTEKSLRLIQWRSKASDLEVACNLGGRWTHTHTHKRAGRDPVREKAGGR